MFQHIKAAGAEVIKKNGGKPPTLVVVILPEGSPDLYRAAKQYVLRELLAITWELTDLVPTNSFGDIAVSL